MVNVVKYAPKNLYLSWSLENPAITRAVKAQIGSCFERSDNFSVISREISILEILGDGTEEKKLLMHLFGFVPNRYFLRGEVEKVPESNLTHDVNYSIIKRYPDAVSNLNFIGLLRYPEEENGRISTGSIMLTRFGMAVAYLIQANDKLKNKKQLKKEPQPADATTVGAVTSAV